MKKARGITALLFIAVYLVLAVAEGAYGNDYQISLGASAHQQFGLFYPVTYRFAIPAGLSSLTVQYRYSPEAAWSTLTEKTSSDTFNGIDAVRFDYAGHWAYISIGFSSSSDHIYLRMLDGSGTPVNFTFDSIPTHYDGRKAAVTVSLDDWSTSTDANFRAATGYLAADGLYVTVGVITRYVNWTSVQQMIDQRGRYMEVVPHGASHLCTAEDYTLAGYDNEIIGSRDAIRSHLSYWGHPYVPVYIEPCGYSDPTLVSTVTAANYLLTRRASNYFPEGSAFVEWDSVQKRYGRASVVYDDSIRTWSAGAVTESNSLFDRAVTDGGIYHLMDHPRAGYWYDASYLMQHLNYIKGRKDIWYVPLGQMYMYHFIKEMRGGVTMQSIDSAVPAPTANFTASPVSGTAPLTVTFSDTSTGSITGRTWDFGDSTRSTEMNPVHVYRNAGSYTVSLTVTGPGGSGEKVQQALVVVAEAAPVAAFSATHIKGSAPYTVSFIDTSTGTITSRLWDFGDSTSSTETNPVHAYAGPGPYTVKLTVTGPGGSNQVSRSIKVTRKKGPWLPILLDLLQ